MSEEINAVIFLVITALIGVLVFVLNPMTIVAILRTPSLRRCHSNIFLLNLAVVDILNVVTATVFGVRQFLGLVNKTACILDSVFLGIVVTGSMLSCFAIAVDRYLFIHKAMTYTTVVTRARVVKVVLFMWVASILMGFLPILDGQILTTEVCMYLWTPARRVQAALTVLQFILVGVISVCLYTKLFFIIRDHNKVLETHARAHCQVHDCRRQSCKVKSTLGECHLGDEEQSSAASNLRTTKGESEGDEPENTHILPQDNTKSLALSADSCRNKKSFCSCRPEANSNNISLSPSQTASRATEFQHLKHEHEVKGQSSDATRATVQCETKQKDKPKRKIRFGKCQHFRDIRTIKRLTLMFAIYFVCWAPAMVVKFILYSLNIESSQSIHYAVWLVAMTNSVWNFIVYHLRKKELKAAILGNLGRCARCGQDHGMPGCHASPGGGHSTSSSVSAFSQAFSVQAWAE